MLGFTTFYRFTINYRQTILGPLWVLVQPIAFILFLGALFTNLSSANANVFLPHLGIGYVAWTLLGGYLSRGPSIFVRNKPFIMDANRSLTDAVMLDNLELVVQFVHRILIIIALCLIFKSTTPTGVIKATVGLFIIIINGYFYSMILSILATRFKDLQEAVTPLNNILFLATPIIWMPGPTAAGRGMILENYMQYNPFYHFLEIFRAPLLSKPIEDTTIIFVSVATIVGFVVSCILYGSLRSIVPHWANS